MSKKIGVFVGSLRKDSFNKTVADYMASVAPEGYEFEFVDLKGIDFFDQDLEGNPPKSWVDFRDEVKSKDAFLFVTPEYNRSIPGVLKNAIDVASRPYGESVWNGKPGGVVSVSPGAIGGFGANHHLRQVLTFLNVYTLQQPEAYIGNIMNALDDSGNLVDESVKGFLKAYVDAFVAWVDTF